MLYRLYTVVDPGINDSALLGHAVSRDFPIAQQDQLARILYLSCHITKLLH